MYGSVIRMLTRRMYLDVLVDERYDKERERERDGRRTTQVEHRFEFRHESCWLHVQSTLVNLLSCINLTSS
jgi:hypothetical protein